MVRIELDVMCDIGSFDFFARQRVCTNLISPAVNGSDRIILAICAPLIL
jgi:hypothetical protein